jgi:hypothetical protein
LALSWGAGPYTAYEGDLNNPEAIGPPISYDKLDDAPTLERIHSIRIGKDAAQAGWSGQIEVAFTLEHEGRATVVRTKLVVPGAAAEVEILLGRRAPSSAQVQEHLLEHALYYSDAVWGALDPTTLSAMLSSYDYTPPGSKTPVTLSDLVEPLPISLGNGYMVFRMPVEPDDEWWTKWLTKRKLDQPKRTPKDTLVPVPTGGVFTEAVLGRSNSAEKLDITRFWDWQDSPPPLVAPEIAAIQTGTKTGTDETPQPGQLGAPVLNIQNSPPLPDPVGTLAVLQAVQNGNLFRDMGGLAALQAVTQAGIGAASAGATAAGEQAGQAAESARQLASDLIKAGVAAATGVPVAGGDSGGPTASRNNSGVGAMLNQGEKLDAKATAAQTPAGGGGSESDTPPDLVDGPGANETAAFEQGGDRSGTGHEAAAQADLERQERPPRPDCQVAGRRLVRGRLGP